MGLAGTFGDQAYVCKSCGHTTSLYSPQCPVCLNKSLCKINPEKQPGPSQTNPNAPSFESSGSGHRFPLEMVAIVVALIVVTYSVFFAKKPDTTQVENPNEPVKEVRPVRTQQPRRVVRHTAPAQSSRPHAAASASAPRRAAPMKLWSASDDE
jgi:hypothetical protein